MPTTILGRLFYRLGYIRVNEFEKLKIEKKRIEIALRCAEIQIHQLRKRTASSDDSQAEMTNITNMQVQAAVSIMDRIAEEITSTLQLGNPAIRRSSGPPVAD